MAKNWPTIAGWLCRLARRLERTTGMRHEPHANDQPMKEALGQHRQPMTEEALEKLALHAVVQRPEPLSPEQPQHHAEYRPVKYRHQPLPQRPPLRPPVPLLLILVAVLLVRARVGHLQHRLGRLKGIRQRRGGRLAQRREQERDPRDRHVHFFLEHRDDALRQPPVEQHRDARVERQHQRRRVAGPERPDAAALPAHVPQRLRHGPRLLPGGRHLAPRDDVGQRRRAGLGRRAREHAKRHLLHHARRLAAALPQKVVEAEEEEAVDDGLGDVGAQAAVERGGALVAHYAAKGVEHAGVLRLVLELPLHLEPCRDEVERREDGRRRGGAKGAGDGVAERLEGLRGGHGGGGCFWGDVWEKRVGSDRDVLSWRLRRRRLL